MSWCGLKCLISLFRRFLWAVAQVAEWVAAWVQLRQYRRFPAVQVYPRHPPCRQYPQVAWAAELKFQLVSEY